MPASVTIIPEKECPTRTVGPSCRASTRSAEATASGSVVSGFCTAVTLRPAACKRAITSDQDDPSANNPCTRTTFRAIGAGGAAAFASRMRVLAAPAVTMLTKVRRFIGYLMCEVAVCSAEPATWIRECQGQRRCSQHLRSLCDSFAREPPLHLYILEEGAFCYVASRGCDSEITYASTIEVATPILVADY